MPAPRTRFITAPDGGRVAYQVVGDGDRDVVFIPDWLWSVDLMWENPAIARFLDGLAELGRLIMFDKRGCGGSDPASTDRTLMGATAEQGAEDLLSILDAARSVEVEVVATTTGAWPAMLLAATAPQRVRRLVLLDPVVRLTWAEDFPHGLTPDLLDQLVRAIEHHWGEGTSLLFYAPELWSDVRLREWLGRVERLSSGRLFMLNTWRNAAEADMRSVLPLVQADALVIAHADNSLSGQSRYIASRLASSRVVEIPGTNLLDWGNDQIQTEIRGFLGEDSKGARDANRVLATLLFTDIVDSTSQLASVGDQRWRQLLDEHDELGVNLVERFRGRVVKRTGDGLLAMFDGPARAVRCATALASSAQQRLGVELRAGVHTGEVELRGDDVGGMSVHVAARVMAEASGGEVLITRTVKDLTTGSGLTFTPLGVRSLKGVPDPWEVYAASD